MKIETTGAFLEPIDPLGVHSENLIVDISRMKDFFRGYFISWNYPEAIVQNDVYFNNVTIQDSPNPYVHIPRLIASTLPANLTILNINCSNFKTLDIVLSPWVMGLLTSTWLPDDNIPQYSKFDNIFDSNRQYRDVNDK